MYYDGLGRLYLYLYLFAFISCVFVLLPIFRRIKVYIMGRLRPMTLECERCGLVLYMSRVAWSVCLSVCVCWPCKNGWTDREPVWGRIVRTHALEMSTGQSVTF